MDLLVHSEYIEPKHYHCDIFQPENSWSLIYKPLLWFHYHTLENSHSIILNNTVNVFAVALQENDTSFREQPDAVLWMYTN